MDTDLSLEREAKLLAPLVLAYIGDAVYEVYVRNRIIKEHPDMPVHKLHKAAIKYVRAHGQSEAMTVLEEELSDEELSVYKRGRNTKSATVPKNADVTEYRRATGFEALIGFLYKAEHSERLEELMEKAFNTLKNSDK